MKTSTLNQNKLNKDMVPRPDSVTRHKMLERFVDQMLVVAMGAASMAILLFFISIG